MGICLDKEVRIPKDFGQFQAVNGINGQPRMPEDFLQSDLQSTALVLPKNKVPVIFVLGGPGSGKITHCGRMVGQLNGWHHVNMGEVMMGMLRNSVDTSTLSTPQATGALLTWMEKKKDAAGFLVSGFPRNIDDTKEFQRAYGRVDAVLLLNWHLHTLERQIEHGARAGEVDLHTAMLELAGFKRQVIPVAEHFDHRQLLHLVRGDRGPEPVFADFQQTVESITQEINKRPTKSAGSYREFRVDGTTGESRPTEVEMKRSVSQQKSLPLPPLVWILGGPGSCKASRVVKAVEEQPWTVLNFGEELRNVAEMDGGGEMEEKLKQGQLLPQNEVVGFVEHLLRTGDSNKGEGLILAGFPRTLGQARAFEQTFSLRPVAVLLDCSELELGRNLGERKGRGDDNLEAYKNRLAVYREHGLPLAKALDEEGRLRVVDGDMEPHQVIDDLRRALNKEIKALAKAMDGEEEEKGGEEEIFIDLEDGPEEEAGHEKHRNNNNNNYVDPKREE